MNPKSIEEIVSLSDDAYAEYVGTLANIQDGYWVLDEIDDALLKIVEQQPENVERICGINSKIFEDLRDNHMRVHLIGYNFNTKLIAASQSGRLQPTLARIQ